MDSLHVLLISTCSCRCGYGSHGFIDCLVCLGLGLSSLLSIVMEGSLTISSASPFSEGVTQHRHLSSSPSSASSSACPSWSI